MDTLDISMELLSSEGACSGGFEGPPDVPGVSSVDIVTAVADGVVVVPLAGAVKLVLLDWDRRMP